MQKQVDDARVELSLEIPAGDHVLGDENHIVQILINLMQNTVDALESSPAPRITIPASAQMGALFYVIGEQFM